MEHYAVYGKTFTGEDEWPENFTGAGEVPELAKFRSGKGVVFSDKVLERFIEDDYRHGYSPLVDLEGRSLRSFSSGERRKALLNYLLKQNPDYILLDSPFESLDEQSVEDIKIKLEEISKQTSILQFFKRKEDLLPFIEKVLPLENNRIGKIFTAEDFLAGTTSQEKSLKINSIPAPDKEYQNIPEVLMKLENVSVNYEGRPILANISWEIKKGEFWKLTGPNGSGKTTILSMIYGDNPKAYGENVFLFGNKKGSGETVWEIKRKIGYFSPALTELFSRRNTAQEMLVSGLVDSVGLYQNPSDRQLALAGKWLKTLNLEHRERQIFTKLPLLEQRMLLIARAMIKHPPLLILDEPTTALDDESALKITRLINLIAAESETAVVFVSHRKEKGLEAQLEYRLIAGESGSVGEIVEN